MIFHRPVLNDTRNVIHIILEIFHSWELMTCYNAMSRLCLEILNVWMLSSLMLTSSLVTTIDQ